MKEFLFENIIQFEILGQLALAAFLGSVIGIERERAGKAAGIRTHMIVAAASTMIFRLSEILVNYFRLVSNEESLQADPTRIVVAIVMGISFIGAGTIIRMPEGSKVEGLTTAATLLFAAVVGMAVGLSQYIIAIGGVILILIILIIIRRILIIFRKNIHSPDD